jgi:TolB-like protein
VGIVPFADSTGKSENLSHALTERVTTELVKGNRLTITPFAKSENLDRIFRELKNQAEMSEAGFMNPSTIQQAGASLPVDALLIGKLTDHYQTIGVDCQLYDVKTGQVLNGAAASAEITKSTLTDYQPSAAPQKPNADSPSVGTVNVDPTLRHYPRPSSTDRNGVRAPQNQRQPH